jgi:hypothetical protein
VGFDYQVKSAQEAFRDNQWQSRELVETRVRWEPRLGTLQRHYDNIPVSALADQAAISALVGEYRTNQSQPYNQAAARDVPLLVPDLDPESTWSQAQAGFNTTAAAECQQAAAGQHIRNFRLDAIYQNVHWTQMLLPVYISHYTDDEGKPQMVFVNGQTGQIGGLRLASQRKGWFWGGILAGAGIGLFLIGLLCLLLAGLLPALGLLGIAFIAGGILVALSALVPVIWPWQWNRGQQERRLVVF